jgi:hypothetical protein
MRKAVADAGGAPLLGPENALALVRNPVFVIAALRELSDCQAKIAADARKVKFTNLVMKAMNENNPAVFAARLDLARTAADLHMKEFAEKARNTNLNMSELSRAIELTGPRMWPKRLKDLLQLDGFIKDGFATEKAWRERLLINMSVGRKNKIEIIATPKGTAFFVELYGGKDRPSRLLEALAKTESR